MNSKAVGILSEQKTIVRLLELGYIVSRPIGDNSRYDLIIDNGKLYRVQVKTGRLRNGIILFNRKSVTWNRTATYTTPYTKEEIDWFLVYCPDTNELYKVPVEDRVVHLRVNSPKNNQVEHIKWAKNYVLS